MKTVVIPTRNDNYGMFLAERAMQCLNAMTSVFDEVIVVDWNSPHGLPMIEQIKNYIAPTGKIRSIVVPRDFVESKVDSQSQPCCSVLARNIGIRRAKGDWIVSSNIDIIPTQFSTDRLNRDTMYVVQKYNVLENVHLTQLLPMSTEQKIQALVAHKHLFERMKRCEEVVPDDKYSLCVGCGDFQVAHRDVWNRIRGFEESLVYRCFEDTNVLVKTAHQQDMKTSLLDIDVFHLEHKNNPFFWQKDGATKRNNKDDAFTTYAVTQNGDGWGFDGFEFQETII